MYEMSEKHRNLLLYIGTVHATNRKCELSYTFLGFPNPAGKLMISSTMQCVSSYLPILNDQYNNNGTINYSYVYTCIIMYYINNYKIHPHYVII